MASRALPHVWPVVVVAGPMVGLVLGSWVRRALSRRLVLGTGAAAILVVAMAFTPVSLSGVLADHFVLAVAYVYMWLWLGMVRSFALRAALFGVPTLGVLWAVTRPLAFFLILPMGDLTAMPERTISIDCGWSTRGVRMRRYGWVARSGYELQVYSRPCCVPLEFERDTRRFDDAHYSVGDRFSARVVGGGDCTTVIAYDGQDEWSVR